MDVLTYCGLDFEEVRDHPYVAAAHDRRSGYYDFKVAPELVSTVLEDFSVIQHTAAAAAFYDLVIWVNGSKSLLESNDCRFSPARVNQSPDYARPREAAGRLMIFFRDLVFNTEPEKRQLFNLVVERCLREQDPELRWAAVRIAHAPIRLHYLQSVDKPAEGSQLVLNFWSWGFTDEEVYGNLRRLFDGMNTGLVLASEVLGGMIPLVEQRAVRAEQTEFCKELFNITTKIASRRRDHKLVLTHLRRLSDETLLCGRSILNQAFIGSGNVPSVYADNLNLCRVCRVKFQVELEGYLTRRGLQLSELDRAVADWRAELVGAGAV